ncbi:YtxH domain-containing protein [Bacillus salipaludis]|uniref:YtxH domain-containing protein n=1 Tax=Bacillus salipaludis TaxID=2547811 RepID=A0ABW8RMG7_9BACI
MKVKPFLYGFIAGGLAAGISSLLIAPNAGKVTRDRIKENKQLMLSQLQELKTELMQLKDSITNATKEGKKQISKFLSEVKFSLAHWEKEVKPQQLEIQKEIIEMKETVQELEEEILEYSK